MAGPGPGPVAGTAQLERLKETVVAAAHRRAPTTEKGGKRTEPIKSAILEEAALHLQGHLREAQAREEAERRAEMWQRRAQQQRREAVDVEDEEGEEEEDEEVGASGDGGHGKPHSRHHDEDDAAGGGGGGGGVLGQM